MKDACLLNFHRINRISQGVENFLEQNVTGGLYQHTKFFSENSSEDEYDDNGESRSSVTNLGRPYWFRFVV